MSEDVPGNTDGCPTCGHPHISTYDQLSAATGIPVERLVRLRVFAPEPEPEGPVVHGHTVALEFRTQDLPRWQPRMQPEYFPKPEEESH